ncbi:hypothetical protein GLW03_12750 [Halobacillus halophilus]|uniref:hypothetical protein n=1 Tax=Halobacillus halophilus TaxID=1570 RepID=UPI001368838A|nr:hypothetical protein [Halobacillus halophilus]MYL30695.1 hypothetical protein [Halobacillus halophilus]
MDSIAGQGRESGGCAARKLSWTKNVISYLLVSRMAAVRNETNERSVTRQHLAGVAHSFH